MSREPQSFPALHLIVRTESKALWGPWVSFIVTCNFSVRVTTITSMIGVSWTHSVLFWFQLNDLWPFYQKNVKQITLNLIALLNLGLQYSRPLFEFSWLWMFSWIKLSWHWLYVLIMWRTHFRVNLNSMIAWMSRNSLLKAGAKS